jgi:hypothetical protein
MDLTSKNHNHNSFDQRLKWIQLPKITTLWSQTQMDPTYQNHNTLITDPNGSNFPESQHFDQRPKWIQLTKITTLWSETQMDPTYQNHNTLIRDPNGSKLPKITTLWSQTQMDPTSQNHNTWIRDSKCIQLPENLPRKTTFWCEYWEYLFIHDATSHSLVAWKLYS